MKQQQQQQQQQHPYASDQKPVIREGEKGRRDHPQPNLFHPQKTPNVTRASLLGSFWGRFGVVLGSIWGRLWGRFGVVSGSFWGRFGVVLGSFWGRGRFGVVLGSFRGRFGVVLGSFWGRFGVDFGVDCGVGLARVDFWKSEVWASQSWIRNTGLLEGHAERPSVSCGARRQK